MVWEFFLSHFLFIPSVFNFAFLTLILFIDCTVLLMGEGKDLGKVCVYVFFGFLGEFWNNGPTQANCSLRKRSCALFDLKSYLRFMIIEENAGRVALQEQMILKRKESRSSRKKKTRKNKKGKSKSQYLLDISFRSKSLTSVSFKPW